MEKRRGERVIRNHAPRIVMALVILSSLTGCSVVTEREAALFKDPIPSSEPAASGDAAEALKVALAQRGTRYRAGGNSPSEGFDCSGLVHFSFNSVGIRLPRSSQDMFHATRRIAKSQLKPGDLVFFRQRSSRITHVGIYAGNGQFVHAPTRGKDVELTSLNDPYWSKRFAGAGRVEASGSTLASN